MKNLVKWIKCFLVHARKDSGDIAGTLMMMMFVVVACSAMFGALGKAFSKNIEVTVTALQGQIGEAKKRMDGVRQENKDNMKDALEWQAGIVNDPTEQTK